MSDAWFDAIYLEDEQGELLAWMVEGERSLPSEKHGKFLLIGMLQGYVLIHPHLGERPAARPGDLESLADSMLLRRDSNSRGDPNYEITPQGRRYYAEMKRRSGEAAETIEAEVHRYLDAGVFQAAFPAAYERWREAEEELWAAETEIQFTRIGHLCREAMQAFASTLANRTGIADMPSDPAKTVQRIRSVLAGIDLGDRHRALLDALLPYWGAVSDLVQRQEHGAQKEGEPLVWEDARRVVFQTAIVMFESPGSFSPATP